MSLIAFNINNQSHKNHTNAPHHAAGRSPLSTQGHAFILTFFILQTLQLRDIHHNNYIIYNY